MHAAAMRRADGNEARHAAAAVAPQVGPGDQPSHAVPDEGHARRSGRRDDRVDAAGELGGEAVDGCQRRPVRDRVNGTDAEPAQGAAHAQPHAGIAQHAMDEQHRRGGHLRRWLAHEPPAESHAQARAHQRGPLAPEQAHGAAHAKLCFRGPFAAVDPCECKPEAGDCREDRHVSERQGDHDVERIGTGANRGNRPQEVSAEAADEQQHQRECSHHAAAAPSMRCAALAAQPDRARAAITRRRGTALPVPSARASS